MLWGAEIQTELAPEDPAIELTTTLYALADLTFAMREMGRHSRRRRLRDLV